MDHVHPGVQLAAEADDECYGFVLCLPRPRAQKGAIAPRVGRRVALESFFHRPGQLRVDNQHGPQGRQFGQGGAKVGLCDVAKLLHAGVDQKTLESQHARSEQVTELRGVSRHHPAPEPHVHPAARLRRFHLGAKSLEGRGRGNTVQRHVHQRGHTARSGCARRGLETFPVRAAGFVDVHVRIHQARHDYGVACVKNGAPLRELIAAGDGGDNAAADVNRRRADTIGRRNPGSADDEGRIHHLSGAARPARLLWSCSRKSSSRFRATRRR